MASRLVFNAQLQRETVHEIIVDPNGEVLFTCTENGAVLKLPANLTKEEMIEKLAEHKAANMGQVNIEASYAAAEELNQTEEEIAAALSEEVQPEQVQPVE